jgi:hypothetical protein
MDVSLGAEAGFETASHSAYIRGFVIKFSAAGDTHIAAQFALIPPPHYPQRVISRRTFPSTHCMYINALPYIHGSMYFKRDFGVHFWPRNVMVFPWPTDANISQVWLN